MAKLRAAVLAAGRGTRMGGATPKTLLPLGDHEPLLHYILVGLERAGVDDVLFVTGHRSEDIERYVSDHPTSSTVAFVRNARYASWGNFHTVRVALDQSPGTEVLIVNSDVVVHPDVYRRVAETPGDLVLAVQRARRLDQEDMRVQLSGNRVLAIGKDLLMPLSHGEYAGVSLLRADAARAYAETSTDLEWRARTTLYYEDVYGLMIERGIDAHAADVEAGEYAEVDTPDDVAGAVSVVERHAGAWTGDKAASDA